CELFFEVVETPRVFGQVSTKRFPFTKQGFKAFKRCARRRLDDESAMRLDAGRQRDYAMRQRK
ncbi:hypothetical protein Tco_0903723, partial [Tanacetum coccineum]